MASGRPGGCYRVHGFRDREADFGVFTKEYDWVRKGDKGYGRVHARGRDRLDYTSRVGRKVTKERGVMKGGYSSTSSLSDSENHGMGPRRCGVVAHPKDREPGELSGDGSESDGAVDTENHVINETRSSVHSKKRKSSPFVLDREDRHISQTVKIRNISAESCRELPKSNLMRDACMQTSLADNDDLLSGLSEAPVETTSLSMQEELCVNNLGTGVVNGDADYETPRTIISSRWENNAYSPADEGKISDHGDNKELTSPKFGEVIREGDEYVRSSSRDSKHDGDGNYDDDQIYDGVNVSHSESEDDCGFNGTPEPASPPRRCVNMLQGCRSVCEFERLNKINEGTYGVVFRAKDKKTGEIVALKKVKMEKEREGFPLTALREINILLSSHHQSIVDVKEVVVGSDLDSIFMVMEYMEHDLRGLMDSMKQPFSQSEVKCLMLQLLEGIDYLHDNWVLHRDLKTSNLLLNNRGELKICDFGLARQYGSPLKPYTELVVTLWYRAPELLLGAKQYSTAIDMWSLGCIMAELLTKEPLFNGKSEADQLDKIFKVLGTPNAKIWPGISELPGKVNFGKHKYNILRTKFPATSFTGSLVLSNAGFDLLSKLLTYDPDKRITAGEALSHEWFREVPLPKSKDFMPTFPAQHAQDSQKRKENWKGDLGIGGLFGQ